MSDLDRITATEEVSRLLGLAAASEADVYGTIDGEPGIELKLAVRAVAGSNLVLGARKSPDGAAAMIAEALRNKLLPGREIEIIFSLVEGEFAVREAIVSTSLATVTVNVGHGLLRLQRRKDFRVSTKTHPIKFISSDKKITVELIDLSAGGMRVNWTPNLGSVPATGAALRGILTLPTGVNPEITAHMVKNHGPVAGGSALSFRFEGMGQAEARAVFFACLHISRRS